MKKRSMKAFVLAGVASGLLISAQGYAHEGHETQVSTENHMIAGNCGSGSCSGYKNRNQGQNQTADRTRYNNSYTADDSLSDQTMLRSDTTTSEDMISESDLLSQVNDQSKMDYSKLDAAGKMLARKLAAQPQYAADKNQAIKEAVKRTAEKKGAYNSPTNSRQQSQNNSR